MIPVAITGSLLNRMPKEDEVMHKEFGKQWEKWAKDVPYKLVPYVY
jgi:protein-S-isoprenylcysteine O-methyltransferase Ste14